MNDNIFEGSFYGLARGNKREYDQEKYKDIIFFAEDKGVIIMNGILFGFNSSETEGIVSDVQMQDDVIFVTFTNGEKHELPITKKTVGLENVTNDAQVKRDELGAPLGVPTLDENGKIRKEFFLDDMGKFVGVEKFVQKKSDLNTLDPKPEEGEIYFVIDDSLLYEKTANGWNNGTEPEQNTIYNHRQPDELGRVDVIYRWDGKRMVEISKSLVIGEVQGTAYDGAKGKKNRDDIERLQTLVQQNTEAIDRAIQMFNKTIANEQARINKLIDDINARLDGTIDSSISDLDARLKLFEEWYEGQQKLS